MSSSGFPGGHPDYFNLTTNRSNNQRSPLAGILADPTSQIGLRRPDLIGKRSLAEFQHHHHLQQQAAFFLRNVKQRPSPSNYISPLTDFPNSPELSSVSNISSTTSSFSVPRYGVPVMQSFNLSNGNFNGVIGNNNSNLNYQNSLHNNNRGLLAKRETEGKMMKRLQELEKQLLLDDEEDGENDVVSGVTNSEWSETIHNILTVSPSPTSSSCSSSCASSSASPVNPTQLLSDAAAAIADGKTDAALEILTRVTQVSNARGSHEQRLSFYMATALRSRMNINNNSTSAAAAELFGKEHILSTHLLHDKSPCFKLAFMLANDKILDLGRSEKKIHVVDFDIGQGLQYVYLLHEIASTNISISLKLTTFSDFGNGGVERLKVVGDTLDSVSQKLGVSFSFNISSLKLSDLNTSSFKVMETDKEALVVNFGFKLYKLPDESVTTENLRDEVLRRVKGLSPALVIVLEQDLNANTASFETRVSQACGYYGALLESLDATLLKENENMNSERVKIEEGVSRKIMNSVACEGRDRVERCEVFGKWRARMSMAGFELKEMRSQLLRAESLVAKVNSGTRGNPGFTVKEEGGGISFGWMGRSLTVASAWH